MILKLVRDAKQQAEYCTLGVLSVGDRVFQTVERPWIPVPENVCGHQQTSCIGLGLYRMDARYTEARGDHWILSNVALGVYRYPASIAPGVYARSLVLIHVANWAHELLGCIAPGKSRAVMESEWGVAQSRRAMQEISATIAGNRDLQLEIS